MKKSILILILAVTPILATATPSTLIWIPSTDIQPARLTHLTSDIYTPETGDTLTDFGLTWGTGKIEYGFDYFSIDGIEDPVRLNAKFLVKDSPVALAIGTFDVGGDAASNMVYLLGSKTLPEARLTFGFCAGRESVLGSDNKMLLLGVDKQINSKWWAAIDYQSGKSAFGAFNAGIAYTFSPSTSVILGYDWYNDSALEDTVTVQVDANF